MLTNCNEPNSVPPASFESRESPRARDLGQWFAALRRFETTLFHYFFATGLLFYFLLFLNF